MEENVKKFLVNFWHFEKMLHLGRASNLSLEEAVAYKYKSLASPYMKDVLFGFEHESSVNLIKTLQSEPVKKAVEEIKAQRVVFGKKFLQVLEEALPLRSTKEVLLLANKYASLIDTEDIYMFNHALLSKIVSENLPKEVLREADLSLYEFGKPFQTILKLNLSDTVNNSFLLRSSSWSFLEVSEIFMSIYAYLKLLDKSVGLSFALESLEKKTGVKLVNVKKGEIFDYKLKVSEELSLHLHCTTSFMNSLEEEVESIQKTLLVHDMDDQSVFLSFENIDTGEKTLLVVNFDGFREI